MDLPAHGPSDPAARGLGKAGSADGTRASRYFDRVRSRSSAAQVVDDRTWHDLELPAFLKNLDTTLTPIGRQCLYRQLRTLVHDEAELQQRHASYPVLQSNAALREALQLALLPLDVHSSAYVVDLLLGPPYEPPSHHALALPWVLLSCLGIVAAIAHLVSPWMPAGMLAINAFIAWRRPAPRARRGRRAGLRADALKCSVRLAGSSALVTGSNMTGKTTFIKTVATNLILGQTLGICLADRVVMPRSAARAIIRGDQSVESGKSRYFAEADTIRGFLAEAQAGDCRVFVIDEPFSGTNTIERIAVAKAVLRALGAHAQVLVTTHDVELQHLLGAGFELYHFREDPAVEGFFDHKLYAGASTQRNAIRVLERLGFPPTIIQEAIETAALIERRKAGGAAPGLPPSGDGALRHRRRICDRSRDCGQRDSSVWRSQCRRDRSIPPPK